MQKMGPGSPSAGLVHICCTPRHLCQFHAPSRFVLHFETVRKRSPSSILETWVFAQHRSAGNA
eukprot:5828800-Karenia_brevis.AAC.1